MLLFVRSRLFCRPTHKEDITPNISLLIVAHNEATVIRRRLENALTLDYPCDQLRIIVVSDGSNDGTNEIVSEFGDYGIRLLALPREGKNTALNAAVGCIPDDIVVFSDANSMCERNALRALVRHFADPSVGGVAGRQTYPSVENSDSAEFGERTYWNFNQLLGEWESAAGSITNATGGLYAIRRELFSPIPSGTADDVATSFSIIARGYRLVFEPSAIAIEDVASSRRAEFQRKVRICAQGFRSLFAYKQLLNPFRSGFFSLQLFSRKVLRWMMPWPLFALFASAFALAHTAPGYEAAFILQAVFYALALSFWAVPDHTLTRMSLPTSVVLPFFFCLGNAGSLRAQWLTLRGNRCDHWEATSREQQRSAGPRSHLSAPSLRKVAYIMSRFPKITETFILYEILQHHHHGESVEIYPLMREREPAVHPEAVSLFDRVHFQPFLSLAILRANLHYLCRAPRTYLGAIVEVLRGTLGNANFFFGAVVFLPKSVAFAYQMKRSGVTHVHAHFATHPALSALIISRLTGIPFSFTAHGHDVHCSRKMLREKLASAQFAVAISQYNRDLMAEECGDRLIHKIHVIHCGVDTDYFSPAPHPRPAKPLRIICVASLLEVKGHTYLVEACRILRERRIAFHCDLVGAGERRAQIEAQITKAGLGDAFTFHGPQPRAVVRRMFHQANVKVLASVPTSSGLREGIPVALMEAMACGLPVISSQLSGIPELVENGVSGILVAPRDSLALADGLERLAQDINLRVRMGTAGRVRILREFDLSQNASALAKLFSGPASTVGFGEAA
jgi:glycosyltransferase involved in cell wall biosynthesis